MPNKNSENSLNLYAKVEDLLGLKEVAPLLYAHYLLFLNSINFSSLLDVGCGSGDFLIQIEHVLDISHVKGIDLSPTMVSKTVKQGIDAQCVDLCDIEGKFDVITAVFDMLNYLDIKELERFLICVKDHLNDGGFFLCDINTLFGFENVAVGSLIVDNDERFLTVDSDFEEGIYCSEFTLFEKESQYFKKSQETITQYHHALDSLVKLSGFELVEKEDINLYRLEESDKLFVVLKKI